MSRRAAPAALLGCALALLPMLTAAQVAPATDVEPQRADQAYASYAFAPELGSGVYEIDGRALQIYRIPLEVERSGWRLTLPITLGLYDFRSTDVIDLDLPSGIGSFSLTPGIETDLDLRSNWRLTPWAKAGYTWTSGAGSDSVNFGLGFRSTLLRPGATFDAGEGAPKRAVEYQFYNEVRAAAADLRGELPGDEFLRLRSALRLDLATGARPWKRELRVAPYLLVDLYLDAPTAPVSGVSADRLQQEVGLSLTLTPRPRWWLISLPGLGLGYRFAGSLSGWRLAFGMPF
ncbi:MAG: hypothetical protein ABI859_19280 [Pseudomonadota bacterium]